jgi:hypothetical protein
MGQAEKLFNGAAEQTLINRVVPTPEQQEFLQVQWNALAESMKGSLSTKSGYSISARLQGSYKYGTLIKPVHAGEEYDVDVGVYFHWDDEEDVEPAPKQLRDWVQNELLEYAKTCEELKQVEVPKERCSRATYTRQFHIDTPVYHLNPDTDQRRLACLSGTWESSDPKAIYKWFKEAVNSGDRDQLRRLIRYLKAWAAVSFDDAPDSRPPSILLTVVVTEIYAGMWLARLGGMADDDALISVVRKMHDRLTVDRDVLNPIDSTESLNRMSKDGWDGFLPRLAALRDIADRADEAGDEAKAALIWSEAFSFLMPLPETDQVEIVEESSGCAVMQLPEIDIEVFARNPKSFLVRHRNEVPQVAKDRNLIFKIVNPHVVPEFATVEWTVRNEGNEADLQSDLGHRRLGIKLLTAEEHTAYAGRHFMDCVIRLNGQVYAVRRVSVTVLDHKPQPRNPSKPAYVKLRSFLKRR